MEPEASYHQSVGLTAIEFEEALSGPSPVSSDPSNAEDDAVGVV